MTGAALDPDVFNAFEAAGIGVQAVNSTRQ
jgi:hypothetical protein